MNVVTPPRGGLYVIADEEALRPRDVTDSLLAIAESGVEWIQLRAKTLATDDLYRLVEKATALLGELERAPKLWLNDRVDIALLHPVDGVHLGQSDLPPEEARRLLGAKMWIGLSTHSLEQAAEAELNPAVDVVACGPVYPTVSKQNPDPVIGLRDLARLREVVQKPLVAIGGIDAGRLGEVLAAEVDAAAMIGAVCRAPDIPDACRRLLALSSKEAHDEE
ncbi:MAG: thiamine phosphate synthase [Acidobacteriota bacterium]